LSLTGHFGEPLIRRRRPDSPVPARASPEKMKLREQLAEHLSAQSSVPGTKAIF